jgi:hypothetical protein
MIRFYKYASPSATGGIELTATGKVSRANFTDKVLSQIQRILF